MCKHGIVGVIVTAIIVDSSIYKYGRSIIHVAFVSCLGVEQGIEGAVAVGFEAGGVKAREDIEGCVGGLLHDGFGTGEGFGGFFG